jgi:hypothetical protein
MVTAPRTQSTPAFLPFDAKNAAYEPNIAERSVATGQASRSSNVEPPIGALPPVPRTALIALCRGGVPTVAWACSVRACRFRMG